jgi:hypothetical protein
MVMNNKDISDWESLESYALGVSNDWMSTDLSKYLNKYKEKLCTWPAAAKHHHNHEGGLLKHTLEVLDFSSAMYDMVDEDKRTKELNDEIIFCAAIHDVGKINEYYFDEKEEIWKYKRPELEHSQWIIYDWNMNSDFKLNLRITEALLSHHGGWSKAGNGCNSLLAAILHSADLISSRM